MDFEQPQSGTWLKCEEINGHLLLVIAVHRVETKFDQMYNKEKEQVEFTCVDLDAANPAPFTALDSHTGIVNRIRNLKAGALLLGRIGQAPSKQGNPAWILAEFTPGVDDVRARAFIQANPQVVEVLAGHRPPASQFPPPARNYPAGGAPPMPRPAATTSTGTAQAPANQSEIEALRKQLEAAQAGAAPF